MATFSVSSRGLSTVEVRARNWMVALGLGLEEMGAGASVERLACEVLPNGTVIAREIRTGTGFIVQMVKDGEPTPVPVEPVREVPPDSRYARVLDAPSKGAACQAALEMAQGVVPAESGAVIVRDRDYLRFAAASGPHARELVGLRLKAGSGVVGFVMDNGRALVLDDASQDARHCRDVDALTGYQTRALAAVPVRANDGVHGVIEVINLPAGFAFTRRHIQDLQAVGDALAQRLTTLRA